MSIRVLEDGTIKLSCGDTSTLHVKGIPTDKSYYVYFSVRKKSRELVFPEIVAQSEGSTQVDIVLTNKYTDKLVVPNGMTSETYFYGVKVCSADLSVESTAFVANGDYGSQSKIIVCPKKVEGGR